LANEGFLLSLFFIPAVYECFGCLSIGHKGLSIGYKLLVSKYSLMGMLIS